jgi:hypothetical protein
VERIERPSLILYVERDRFGSALCLYIACLLLPLAWSAGSAAQIGPILWALFAGFLTGAFRLLFRQRELVIDRDRNEVRFMERGLFIGIRRRALPLDQVTVWIHSELEPSQPREVLPRRGSIVLGGPGGPGILFLRSTGKPNLLDRADRLAADLGCPLYLNLRSRAPGSESLTFQRTQPTPADPIA